MLCLRALVPAGFMLVPGASGLEVVLCDQDAARRGQLPRDPADHSHHHGSLHHHLHPDPTCPYAQSSGPAPLPVLPQMAVTAAVILTVARPERAQTNSHFGPERRQSPRAPPLSA
jgi:hypothetical protein